jgi:hypothetical protein
LHPRPRGEQRVGDFDQVDVAANRLLKDSELLKIHAGTAMDERGANRRFRADFGRIRYPDQRSMM